MTHHEHRLLGFAGETPSEVPNAEDTSFEAQASADSRVNDVRNGIRGTDVSMVADHMLKMQSLEEAWNTAMEEPITELRAAIELANTGSREGADRARAITQTIARTIEQMLKGRTTTREERVKIASLAREIDLPRSMMLVVEANDSRNGWSVTARLDQRR